MSEIWGKKTFCLITGATHKTGKEVAKQFSQKLSPGSTMLLIDLLPGQLVSTARYIERLAPKIIVKVFFCNMSKPRKNFTDDFTEVLTELSFKEYDVYLYALTYGHEGFCIPMREHSDLEQWDLFMTTNLYSLAALTSSFLNVFKHEDRTVIVTIDILTPIQAMSGMGEYKVCKAAREMYMKVLSVESPKLRVLSFTSPGPLYTPTPIHDVCTKVTIYSFHIMNRLKLDQAIKTLVERLANGLPPYSQFDYYDQG